VTRLAKRFDDLGDRLALWLGSLRPVFLLATVLFILMLPTRGLPAAGAESPGALMEALEARKAGIEEREAGLKEREARLHLLEEEIRAMIKAHTKLKQEFEQREANRLSQQQQEEEKQIARLVKIFQSMPPKDAAERIGKLKESTAIELFRRIKEKDAAKILSHLNPEKAAQYSEKFIKVPK